VTAQVGEHFPAPEIGPPANRVDLWRVIGAAGDVAIDRAFRLEKTLLSADAMLPSAGVYLGVMTIAVQTIEMKGAEFTDYLKDEGLESVIAARKSAGETDAPARERYARYAKIAVRTGPGDAASLLRPVGLKAEFVPQTDPTSLKPGQPLTVQLLTDGRPVPNAAVTAVGGNGGTTATARTDENGRVSLALDRPGAWLIKTVHMTKLPPGSTEHWESFWVTLAVHTAG